MVNGSMPFHDRISVANTAEILFQQHFERLGYQATKIGFNEQDHLPFFWQINPVARNIPDFYIVNDDGKSGLFQVKGTPNIKEIEFKLLPDIVKAYHSNRCPLYYAFCFEECEPIIMSWQELVRRYEESFDQSYEDDGKVYRRIRMGD